MNLYGTHNDRAGNGRAAVLLAAEYLLATLYALNAAEASDGSSPEYRPFAIQAPGTPYQHATDALDELLNMLARIDGFGDDEAAHIVSRARDTMHDLIGESDPASRAYELAVADHRAEEQERAEEWDTSAYEEARHFGSLGS